MTTVREPTGTSRASAPATGAPARTTGTPVGASEVSSVVERNIRALVAVRRSIEERLPRQERIAETITRFSGSMAFVYLHATLFGAWLVVNTGVVRAAHGGGMRIIESKFEIRFGGD